MNKQRKNNWKELTLIIILTMIASFNFAQTEQDENYFPDSRIQKNGFFIEGYVGKQFSEVLLLEYNLYFEDPIVLHKFDQATILGVRLGNKYYQSSPNQSFSYGFQVTWLKINAGIGTFSDISISMTPLSLGFTSIYEFNYLVGVEFNVDAGVGMSYYKKISNSGLVRHISELGYSVSPNIKLIVAGLAIGLDYSFYSRDWNSKSKTDLAHSISLTLGRKF